MLDDKTFDLYQQANENLVARRNLKRTEQMYMKVIKAYPEYPSAYNQLAVLYTLQGRNKEARTLIEQTHRRFPDYTFASIALARMALQKNRTEEAREYASNPLIFLSFNVDITGPCFDGFAEDLVDQPHHRGLLGDLSVFRILARQRIQLLDLVFISLQG